MSRRGLVTGLSLLLVALASGCAGQVDATSSDTIPNELHTREAYLDTPVVTDDQARAVAPRSTRAEAEARLGRSHVGYRRGGRACTLYPIIGTQRRDAFGSPFADEWELCFDAAGRLAAKTRIRNADPPRA